MMKSTNNDSTIRVGIADDHIYTAHGVVGVLNKLEGIRATLEVFSAEELIETLGQTDEFPHILLMDVYMKAISGIEATKRITEEYPSIKIIAFSSMDDDWTMAQMMIAGACAYIRKDVHPNKLKEILYEVHRKGKYHADLFHLYGEGLRRFAEEIKNIIFTDNEKTYMQLLCKGYNYNQIAETLGLKVKVIDYYKKRISTKLNTNNKALLVIMILRMNQVKLNEEKKW